MRMRKHPKRLSDAGIGPWRYTELQAICRQYREHKRALAWARAGIVDRPRRRSGAWHKPDPTGNAAVNIAAMREQKVVRLVEQSAATVAEPAIAKAILKNVADGVPYNRMRERPPCGRNQFYILCLLFYIELDARLLEEETSGTDERRRG